MLFPVEEKNTEPKYLLMIVSSVSFRPVYTGQDIVDLLLIKTHVLERKEFPIAPKSFVFCFLSRSQAMSLVDYRVTIHFFSLVLCLVTSKEFHTHS